MAHRLGAVAGNLPQTAQKALKWTVWICRQALPSSTGFARVRLIEEEVEHHLPDAPKARQPWYIRLLRRGLTWLFSTVGLTVAVGVALIFALTTVISLNYLDMAHSIDKNNISHETFYATFPMQVVDPEATQRKIDRAKQALTPIYQNVTPHNHDISESLERLLVDLGEVATDPQLPQAERRTRFMSLVSTTPHAEDIFQRFFEHPISHSDWERISSASRRGMQAILKQGFTEADDQLKRDGTLRNSIPGYGFGREYRDLVYFILDSTLEPNLILDEKAMQQNRNELGERIRKEQPEIKVYTQNQKIVGEGERVSQVQLAALAKMGKSPGGNNWVAILGVFLLAMLFVFTLWSYIYNFKGREFFRPSYAGLAATLSLMAVSFVQLLGQGALGSNIPVYAFPLATFALTLAIFTHAHIAVLATTLLTFLIALTMRVDFYQISVLLFGSFMGIYILTKRINFSDRGQLMYAGLYVGATNALTLMAVSLLRPDFGSGDYLPRLLTILAWGFFSGAFSGILTIGILPLLEAIFRLITPYTLMELGNHDQPLLKRMQFEAPGTFHHSLMVATLAETAAEAVNANALLTRVGCLYHDIGKMKRPLFFIENQAYFGVENPHDKLTPRLSKMVITAHPRDSIEMAKQHRLPECLMKFMTEHHGTLTAGYFYNKACIEEGVENVNKSQFRYPGPKPGSKETAIVMLADACESAVRALKNPTVAQVEERIDKIIQQRIEDGQFDNCPLTFKDIEQIKQTFVRVLRGIQHNRIEYQQNMMRELGRKLPTSTVTEHAGLAEVLKEAQKTAEKGDGKSAQQDG